MNNTIESLSQNDIIQLRDCIAFAIDNNDELGANDVIELDQINRALLLLLEAKCKELDEINELKSLLKEAN